MKSSRDAILEHVVDDLLRYAGCPELAGRVQVEWNFRLRTTAGMAHYQRRKITLNPRLVEVAADEVQRTLRHELAHIVAQYRAGRRRISAHGAEWKQACGDLGIPHESRCHDLPFKIRRQARRHFYQCPECGFELARVRPAKRPIACLTCCRKHNGGHYDSRFRFAPISEPRKLAA
ncbi:MAG TPA: SprT-like domain-containing protein [Chthoniobacterales bacterium]